MNEDQLGKVLSSSIMAMAEVERLVGELGPDLRWKVCSIVQYACVGSLTHCGLGDVGPLQEQLSNFAKSLGEEKLTRMWEEAERQSGTREQKEGT